MKDRPIIMKSNMVRAILEGRKTQTRRVCKPQPRSVGDIASTQSHKMLMIYQKDSESWEPIKCPYGIVGMNLWVRETWRVGNDTLGSVFYKADEFLASTPIYQNLGAKWKPSIFMPRAYSRIFLEITDVKVERVQEITDSDAKVEGIEGNGMGYKNYRPELKDDGTPILAFYSPGVSFYSFWDSINLKRGFGSEANPFCWVISFKVIDKI